MKRLLIFLPVCFLLLGATPQAPPPNMDVFDGCGMEGSATPARLKALNRLKNRYTAPQANEINHSITLSAILAPGDDKTRWSSTSGAEITGFVFDVQPGGGETCNCGKTDPAHTDTHIELVLALNDSGPARRVIVEVTPRERAIAASNHVDWSTQNLRKILLKRQVKVTGWMMFDAQHGNAAENTNPGGTHNWRATAWEIHPVTAIQTVP